MDDLAVPGEFPWLCQLVDKLTGEAFAACAIVPNDRTNNVWSEGTRKVLTVAHIVFDKRYSHSIS